MQPRKTERGQALILIVLAIVGMIGLTAVAVDGGMAFSERRQAQNAADSAALDAALARIRGGNVANEGRARAASNGYDNNGTSNSVAVNNPPLAGCNGANGPYAGNVQYVQVVIHSATRTYFGPIIGVTEINNCVEATARAVPPVTAQMYPGFAVVGLAPSGCNAVYVAGNGQLQTWGGGLYSNSTDTCGLHFQGSSQTQTHSGGGLSMAAGGFQVTGNPSVQTHGQGTQVNLPQYPYPPTDLPNPVCTGNATKNGNTMTPGNYSGTFPPNGVDTLQSGIFCLSGSFKMNGNAKLTGNQVLIVLEVGGSLDWNGGAEIKLTAPQSGPFKGLLIFARLGNPNNHPKMFINGNSNSELVGTILMPSVDLAINGNNTQLQKTNSQIIAYKVELSGSSDTQIQTNAASQYQAPQSPILELVQ
jgi:Flp pilus assembly protein TadG